MMIMLLSLSLCFSLHMSIALVVLRSLLLFSLFSLLCARVVCVSLFLCASFPPCTNAPCLIVVVRTLRRALEPHTTHVCVCMCSCARDSLTLCHPHVRTNLDQTSHTPLFTLSIHSLLVHVSSQYCAGLSQ
eukprot:EC791959.1.p1 GENE.EC791959.1~~EC791959.1.p1  ORF type:complete len:131 (+),score=10.13 EC791959.1:172-564(+)